MWYLEQNEELRSDEESCAGRDLVTKVICIKRMVRCVRLSVLVSRKRELGFADRVTRIVVSCRFEARG